MNYTQVLLNVAALVVSWRQEESLRAQSRAVLDKGDKDEKTIIETGGYLDRRGGYLFSNRVPRGRASLSWVRNSR